MAPGPSRRGTGKSRTKSTSQLPSVRDKHQNTEGIKQKVDKDHQKEESNHIASHPLNGWIWFGKGLRCYDNW